MYDEQGFRGSREFAPVKVGDEIDVTIEAVGEKGDGIAKIEGFVIFVPNTKEGDKVRVRITKVLRKVGFGDVVGKSKAGKSKRVVEEEEQEEEQEDKEDF